jgi:hypothetical protein
MMENGAADSTSIAARLVYILDDVSGPWTCRKSARICNRRKHIIEVTMMFKLTVRATHGTPFRSEIGIGRSGRAQKITTMIANTAKRGQWLDNELVVHQKASDYMRTRGSQVHQCRKRDNGPSGVPDYVASVHLSANSLVTLYPLRLKRR